MGTLGINTAMQILLGKEGRGGDAARMHRVEVAALITTLGKFLRSVQTVRSMEDIISTKRQLSDEAPLPMGGWDGTRELMEDD